jgi:hypothetical protein
MGISHPPGVLSKPSQHEMEYEDDDVYSLVHPLGERFEGFNHLVMEDSHENEENDEEYRN